jgi:outer membrane protein assembly factor BamB
MLRHAVLALFLGLIATAAEPDTTKPAWLLFRGDALQTGVVSGKLPAELEILWKFQTKDSIEGAPAVAGGVVYVGSEDEHLYAIDLDKGTEKWKYKATGFKASPAVKGDAVYIGDGDGKFHCVDAKTGMKRWIFESGAEITSGANFSGDKILFGSWDETLYCLDKNGKELWKVKTQGPVNGSPAVAGGMTFVAGCDSSVHIIDIVTGMEKAAVELDGQAAASAAVVGDCLYVGTMSNQVHEVDWKKAKRGWTFQPEKRSQPFFASAAVTDQLVVAGSRDKRVYGLDRLKGLEKWSFITGGQVDSSPVIVGERVYFGSKDGKLYVLDLGGKLIQMIELDSPVTGSAAVAGDRLLIGTQNGTLYCLGKKK